MDFSDPWFKERKPPSQWHEMLILWVPLVGMDGIPRYGRTPPKGENPLFDMVYSTIHSALLGVKFEHLTSQAEQAQQDHLKKLAIIASNQTDAAAAIGSAFVVLEEISDGVPFTVQIDRNRNGYVVNKSWTGATLVDAMAAYVAARQARRKG